MKPTKKFWLWCLAVVLLIILIPPVTAILFIEFSQFFHPIYFIIGIVLLAAVISFFGGIGRNGKKH